MTDTIHRLVYYSHNRIVTTPDELDLAIQEILTASRRNNPRSDVTGALMFNIGCFAQVLEGRSNDVERVFERIQQDERHAEVTVLSFSPVKARCFENWSMSFTGTSAKDAARFDSIAHDTGYDLTRMSGEAIFETLHRLVIEDETAAR